MGLMRKDDKSCDSTSGFCSICCKHKEVGFSTTLRQNTPRLALSWFNPGSTFA